MSLAPHSANSGELGIHQVIKLQSLSKRKPVSPIWKIHFDGGHAVGTGTQGAVLELLVVEACDIVGEAPVGVCKIAALLLF